MADGTPNLRQLTEVDAERAGVALAQAFAIDPLFAYMLPDPDARRRLFPWFFTTCVRYGCHFGEAWAVVDRPDGDLRGTAWWLRLPDAERRSGRTAQSAVERSPRRVVRGASHVGEEAYAGGLATDDLRARTGGRVR